jgi:phosphoserine phosphatase
LRLFVTDMDSTLIAIECIDEIADLAGLKPEVARITEAAMQGELDFREALNARVALLAGIPVARLEELYRERVRLNPGAARLVAALKENGCHCVLVSGGFTFFTERLARELGFDEAHANVIDAAAKAGILRTAAERLGAARCEILAAGDGANDLAMLALAGTRLAWRPKPRILPHVNVVSMAQGLDAVLELLP